MRGYFSHRKAEDAGGLTPGKDDNAAVRKIGRKHELIFKLVDYNPNKHADKPFRLPAWFVEKHLIGVLFFV